MHWIVCFDNDTDTLRTLTLTHFTFSGHLFQHRIVYPCGNIFSISGACRRASERACAHALVSFFSYSLRFFRLFCRFCYFGIRSLVAICVPLFLIFKNPLDFLLSRSVSCAPIHVRGRAHFFHFISYCISINRIRIWLFLRSVRSLLCFSFQFILVSVHFCPGEWFRHFGRITHFQLLKCNESLFSFDTESESSSGIWMRWNWNKQTK